MNAESATTKLVVTAAAAVGTVAAEPFIHTMGVIFMGAFGGALFALMNQEQMSFGRGARFVLARWLLSQFCSWFLMWVIQQAMGERGLSVPQTASLLFLSFAVAGGREFLKEFLPLLRAFAAILRLLPRQKE